MITYNTIRDLDGGMEMNFSSDISNYNQNSEILAISNIFQPSILKNNELEASLVQKISNAIFACKKEANKNYIYENKHGLKSTNFVNKLRKS